MVYRVYSLLKRWKNSTKPYVIYGDKIFTYSKAYRVARHNSDTLSSYGMRDQNIGVLVANSIGFIIAYWSILLSKSTIVPLNVKLTTRELANHLEFCDCNWIICGRRQNDVASILWKKLSVGVITMDANCSFIVTICPTTRRIRENNSDIAAMFQTSGTTGDPKTVMLSHENLIANVDSHIQSLHLKKDDIPLVTLPLYFSYTNTAQLLSHTRLGGTIVIYNKPVFSPKSFCELIGKHQISVVSLVSPMLSILNQYVYLVNHNLHSLRFLCFGSGPVCTDIIRELISKLPNVRFVHTYGLTECSPRVTTHLLKSNMDKLGSVGKPIPGVEAEIVDSDDRVVKKGEIGEIRVRGRNITVGYYKNTNDTKKIKKYGWLYTGDIAKCDDGYIYIMGRKKNIIVTGGICIYPEELEEILFTHPSIKNVLVTGELDRDFGEIPVLHISKKEKCQIYIEDIYSFLEGKIAQFKWPKKLYIRPSLDRTSTGKTKRTSIQTDEKRTRHEGKETPTHLGVYL